jgi:hypothetical protein
MSALLLLLIGFRTKGPWSVVTSALGVIGALRNICIPASVIAHGRSVGGGTSRKPLQRYGRDDQKQAKIGISIEAFVFSHIF